jgi:nickel transport protein
VKKMRKGIVPAVIFIVFVLCSRTAFAHKVSLFAYHENGVVHAEAYFVDGTPCRNAKISASNVKGTVVAHGVTDDKGMFSFPYASSGDLTLTVEASMGHRSEMVLKSVEPEIAGRPPEQEAAAVSNPALQGSRNIDETEIERIVEEKIRPVDDMVREILRNQDKPALGEIIGGLGWIIGLAGAYLWGTTRRKNKV